MTPEVTVSLGGNALGAVAQRALSGRIIESDGEKADELMLEVSNFDGRLQKPKTGQTVTVSLGWKEIGTIKVGQFTILNVSKRGPKAVFLISGHSADLAKTLKGSKRRGWKDPKKLGDVFKDIAQDNQLSPQIDQAVQQIKIETIVAQTDESDMHLMTRLARHHDLIAKVQDGNLVVVPRGKGTAASGQAMGSVTVTPQDTSGEFSFDYNDRNERGHSKGTQFERGKAKRNSKKSQSGSSQGSDSPDWTHAHIFGGSDEAQRHADGRKGKFDRDTARVHLPLRPGLTGVAPGGVIQTQSFGDDDDRAWVCKTRVFSWDAQGLNVSVEGEPKTQNQ